MVGQGGLHSFSRPAAPSSLGAATMQRRQFLLAGGAVAVAAVAGITLRHATQPPADLNALMAELQTLCGRPLTTREGWSPFKVFSHLAQSIELSMTGYPQLKSSAFRHSVGPAAFFAFSTAGAMKHSLTEPIPGAPVIADTGDVDGALGRLLKALETFSAYQGPLAPHFAYGELSKAEYARAHVMHVENHLQAF